MQSDAAGLCLLAGLVACFEWHCLGTVRYECGWTDFTNESEMLSCPKCGGKVAGVFDEEYTQRKGMNEKTQTKTDESNTDI